MLCGGLDAWVVCGEWEEMVSGGGGVRGRSVPGPNLRLGGSAVGSWRACFVPGMGVSVGQDPE